MMDCKNALVEAKGDFDAAIDVLRKKRQMGGEKKVLPEKHWAAGKGFKTGCLSYLIMAGVLGGFGLVDTDGNAIWVILAICAIIGYGVYKNELPKQEKQEEELRQVAEVKKEKREKKKKAAEDATKKEKKRVEDKLDKIKNDAGIEEDLGTEEDQKKRYQEYLDSIKKKK